MYKALLWDIDGTLLDFLAAEEAAIKSLFLKFGFGECTEEMISVYSAINVKYWKKLELGELTKPEILVMRFQEFFEKYGLDTGRAAEFNSAYQLALGDTIVFQPYAEEMLKKYQGKLIQCAITNGTMIAQEKKLRLSGMDQIFDHIFISEIIGIEKPNVGFFTPVFEALEGIDKSEMLVIGDSLTSDIKGGVNAGIDTCFYAPGKDPNGEFSPKPTYVISDLREISKILDN